MDKPKCIVKCRHIPDELCFEILSRMSIKSLLVSRAVCKSWNTMAVSLRNQITHFPSCGLILVELDSYFCRRTKKMLVTDYQMVDSPDELTVMSGYDKGWLGNLSFDFTVLFNQFGFLSVSGGLLLLSLNDGSYLVHNPATKERVIVPKSPMAEKHGSEKGKGAIIGPPLWYGSFIVVRLFCKNKGNHVEYFTSWTGKWFTHMQNPDDYLYYNDSDIRQQNWSFSNYVPLNINGRLMVFFLTDWDSLVVIKFECQDDPMVVHGFRLPEFLDGGSEHARLGECGGHLYLCYSVPDEFHFWQYIDYGGSPIYNDVWVPLLSLKINRQLGEVPVGPQHLVELLNASHRVVTLGFDVDRPVVFLYVKPIIYAYNLANDTLDKIAEVNHPEQHLLQTVYQFTPFFGPLQIPKGEPLGKIVRSDTLHVMFRRLLQEFSRSYVRI